MPLKMPHIQFFSVVVANSRKTYRINLTLLLRNRIYEYRWELKAEFEQHAWPPWSLFSPNACIFLLLHCLLIECFGVFMMFCWFLCGGGDSTSICCAGLQPCTSSWASRAVEGGITPCVLCFLLLKEMEIKKQGRK